jgi:tetratricopeptide (TPR) repeat protein
MPVLQAVEQLCRVPENASFISFLRQRAPLWLVQMPRLLSPEDREVLPRELFGATRERMLREAASTVEALTTKKGLVLVLEDLHWGDHSTVELLSFLARHRETGRLLLLGTYRPEEVLSRGHPLDRVKHELQAHGASRELALQRLGESAVHAYLAQRFSGASLPADFVRLVYQRTDGNPLFLVNVAEHLVERGVLGQQDGQWVLRREQVTSEIGLPSNIRQLIEAQIARLPAPHQAILEVASVAGMSFTTATVAAALGREQEEVEQHCEQLARQGRFLQTLGLAEWPDGTATTRYEFLHALYQETLYERVAVGRRVAFHQRVGQRLEIGYGETAHEIAAELAMHCERGRDFSRAVKYHQHAGENALRRFAHHEAIEHFNKGLALLKTLTETPERDQREFQLLLLLGTAFYMIKGPMAPESEAIYDRACKLSARLAVAPQLAPAYLGLVRYYATRGKLQTAGEVISKLLVLARQFPDAAFLSAVYAAQSGIRFFDGDLLAARIASEHALENYDAQKHGPLLFRLGEEPGILGLTMQTLTLWYLGYPDQAVQKCQEVNR